MLSRNFIGRSYLWLLVLYLCATAGTSFAAASASGPGSFPGIAWKVRGQWQDADSGRPIVTGDMVNPGALLRPQGSKDSHSITVLLPDGQRVLNECFTAEDCDRGFRVPSLIENPSAFQVQMLAQISAVLLDKSKASFGVAPAHTYATPPRLEETFATVMPPAKSAPSSSYRVSLSTGVSALGNGNYTYDLRKADQSEPVAVNAPWKKTSARCLFPVPAPGLYELTIRDALEVPRIDLMVAALRPNQHGKRENFLRAKKILEEWNDENYGWPVHLLLRAYLRSLYGSS